jgi:transcriptional regulator with XRE-family HTH domain
MELDDPAILRRRLRVELKRARHRSNLTQKDVADQLDWSPSKIIRIESGSVNISTVDLRALLAQYKITESRQVEEFTAMAKAAKQPDRWAQFRDWVSPATSQFYSYEWAASVINSMQILVIPGLLQTEEYARAFLRDAQGFSLDRIDALVEVRRVRQDIHERTNPPTMNFVIDEAALRRVVGGTGVMRRQLERLEEANKLTHVNVRIVPFPKGAYPGMRGPFVYLEFADEDDEEVVFLEGPDDRIYHDDPEDVARYAESFVDIQAIASAAEELELYTSMAIEKLPTTRREKTAGDATAP